MVKDLAAQKHPNMNRVYVLIENVNYKISEGILTDTGLR
jgi:hypothetical protein